MNAARVRRRMAAALLLVAAAGLLSPPGCTTGKKRAPGPLRVWLLAEPEAEPMFRTLVDEFKQKSGIEVELVLKEAYEIRALLLNHPRDLEGKVDLIEIDLFDLEDAAPVMDDLTPVMVQLEQSARLYKGSFQAGEFEGRQLLVPWRLSWPIMLASNQVGAPRTWAALGRITRNNPGQVMVPALDDREFFAFLCTLVWSFGGDPAEPYEPGIFEAFQWLQRVSNVLHKDSGATRAAEVASFPAADRPLIFFEWPQGLLPFILNGSLQMDLKAAPCPCGGRGNCPLFSFGRYLGIPKKAPHPEDAQRFILHLISPGSQRAIIFGSPWLPISSDGWGQLGARDLGYRAFSVSANNIKAPPRPLSKIKKAMDEAGKMLLIEHSTADDAITKYRKIMEQE
ncbi:MAG TPA: extracellular solute-binding protein [bacterium]|nr:extracellular solute-binding protein [bacterium]